MDKNKSYKTDEEIVREFNQLFEKIPEPSSDEEIKNYLNNAGYNLDDLKTKGLEFANNLMANNWRFITPEELDNVSAKINNIPIGEGWDRTQLLRAIQKALETLSQGGKEPVLAFRKLEKLTDTDLTSVLQELEYKVNEKGLKLDLD